MEYQLQRGVCSRVKVKKSCERRAVSPPTYGIYSTGSWLQVPPDLGLEVVVEGGLGVGEENHIVKVQQ